VCVCVCVENTLTHLDLAAAEKTGVPPLCFVAKRGTIVRSEQNERVGGTGYGSGKIHN
jgi:hypothetical protein